MLRTTKKLSILKKEVEDKEEELRLLREAIGAEAGNQRIKCPACGKQPKLSMCTYIQTHWYVRPTGCTGGDYWRSGEGQFRCPRCESIIRLYDSPEVEAERRYFGKQEETHDH